MTFTEFKRLLDAWLINPHDVHIRGLHLDALPWQNGGNRTLLEVLDFYYKGRAVRLTEDCARCIRPTDYQDIKRYIRKFVEVARRVRQRAEDTS